MIKQLHKTVAFLMGLCLFILYASVAYAHGSDPNIATKDVINMNMVAVGLGLVGYLLMVKKSSLKYHFEHKREIKRRKP